MTQCASEHGDNALFFMSMSSKTISDGSKWIPKMHMYFSDCTRSKIEMFLEASSVMLPLEIQMGLAHRIPPHV